MSFADVLRERRVAARLTQEQLAELSGVSVRTIRDLERGKVRRPHRESVDLLARALGLGTAEHDDLLRRANLAPTPATLRRTAGAGAGAGAAVPRQLPATMPHFVGRSTELARLSALLPEPAAEPAAGRTVVVSAINGTAGIGKTALSLHFAHSVADRFPDGQLFVNLRGHDPSAPPTAPQAAVRTLLDALGVPGRRIPSDLDAQVALYRSLLAGKRVLIVLDNARDADQVRPLLPGSAQGLVIVTSRDNLLSLSAAEGAHIISLDLLALEDARELFARRLGAAAVRDQQQTVDEIIRLCAGLPLALNIAAAHAAADLGRPLAAYLAWLADTGSRLNALDAGDTTSNVRAVITSSYDALSPAAARMFRLVGGVHPGADISWAAAASLAGATLEDARRALDELTAAHMLAERAPGRFALHDLLRAFAIERSAETESAQERSDAVRRMLDHYLVAASVADRLLLPGTRTSFGEVVVGPDVIRLEFGDYDEALLWCTVELPVLISAVRQAVEEGFDVHAWRIPVALSGFFELKSHWGDYQALNRIALAAAGRVESLPGQALARRRLGIVSTLRGDYPDAEDHLRRAADLFARTGDVTQEAASLYDLARVFELREDPATALKHTERAVELSEIERDRTSVARGLNAMGWYHVQLGRPDRAVAYCEQAIELFHEMGSTANEANSIDSLGYAHHHLGDYEEAASCYLRAVELFTQAGDGFNRASTLANLAETRVAMGEEAAARACLEAALAVFEELGSQMAGQIRARLEALSDGGGGE